MFVYQHEEEIIQEVVEKKKEKLNGARVELLATYVSGYMDPESLFSDHADEFLRGLDSLFRKLSAAKPSMYREESPEFCSGAAYALVCLLQRQISRPCPRAGSIDILRYPPTFEFFEFIIREWEKSGKKLTYDEFGQKIQELTSYQAGEVGSKLDTLKKSNFVDVSYDEPHGSIKPTAMGLEVYKAIKQKKIKSFYDPETRG